VKSPASDGISPEKSKAQNQTAIREFESSKPSHAVPLCGQCPVSGKKRRISGALRRVLSPGDRKGSISGQFSAPARPRSPVGILECPHFCCRSRPEIGAGRPWLLIEAARFQPAIPNVRFAPVSLRSGYFQVGVDIWQVPRTVVGSRTVLRPQRVQTSRTILKPETVVSSEMITRR
jgi:hypothetical protein